MLVKVPGHVAWSGVGLSSYYPTHYMIVKIVEVKDTYDLTFIKQERVIDRNWRDIRKRMIAEIEELV